MEQHQSPRHPSQSHDPVVHSPHPEIVAPAPTPPPQEEGLKGFISTIALLLSAVLIAILLTMFVFQSYQVDGQSMETTLHHNDRLLVVKVPRTWARITRHDYIPNRGDIIIFNHIDGAALEGSSHKQLVKRVIGLPGERVVIKDGTVTVFNREHPEGFSPDKTLPYGSVITTTPEDVDVVVPEGEVFVAGDNRTNSRDSRSFGTVPASDIVGKLGLRVFPFSDIKLF